MVGFLRKKKSDKLMLSHDTVLDRKGKVDGASLLDDNGDPTSGSLFDASRQPGARRNSNQENATWDHNAVAAGNSHTYPPPYPQQAPQYGGAFPQQHPQQQQGAYPVPPVMNTGFGNASAGYPRQYGAHQQQPQQPQQYPIRYGAHQQVQSYGGPQNAYGAPQQPQYPVQYGHYPPPMQPEAPKKSSFFRIPSIGKKN